MTQKKIYSVTAYQLNTENGETTAWLKVPCTSLKAAQMYKKVIQNWYPEREVNIEWDVPVNCETAKRLAEPPF